MRRCGQQDRRARKLLARADALALGMRRGRTTARTDDLVFAARMAARRAAREAQIAFDTVARMDRGERPSAAVRAARDPHRAEERADREALRARRADEDRARSTLRLHDRIARETGRARRGR